MPSSVFQQLLHHNHSTWRELAELEEIRRHLKPTPITPKGMLKQYHSGERLKKNMYRINDANQARMWKPLEQRVRSSSRTSTFRRLGRVQSSSNYRSHNGTHRAVYQCEILGPFYCTECLKHAQQGTYDKQIAATFPGINLTERMLCMVRERSDKASYGTPLSFSLTELSSGALGKPCQSLWYGSQYDPNGLERRRVTMQYPKTGEEGKRNIDQSRMIKQNDLTQPMGKHRYTSVRFTERSQGQASKRHNSPTITQGSKTADMLRKYGDNGEMNADMVDRPCYINHVDYPRENTSEAKQRSRSIILPEL